MKRVDVAEFPELQRAFSGYLHEDFLEEHDSPAAALSAFQEDASAAERRRFQAEATRFLDRTAPLEWRAVRDLLSRLGCRWVPPSRKALISLLTGQ